MERKRHKREGLVGTIVFHTALLLFFLLSGMSYMVPTPEQGILVNFGTSDTGSGEVQPENSGQVSSEVEEQLQETVVSNSSTPEESLTTQETVESIEVNASKETSDVKKPQEPKDPKPEISNSLQNALNQLKQSQSSGGSEGDDDNAAGDKGQKDGAKEAGAYTGNMGGGGNGDYNLGNRKALSRPKPDYRCQEEGVVVIEVKVDRNGKTLDAKVGKGTTNGAECLTKQAIKAAMDTKWQSKPDAPFTQLGTITYRFILN